MIALTITYQDGETVEVNARPFAIELWERATKQKLFNLADGAGMSDMLRIAYEELKLSGEQVGKYDDWAAKIKTVLEVDDPKDPE